jgi:3-(methylthio)propionyl---CoA ligase
MQALMQNRQLLISSPIEHANHYHPDAEIVSRTVEGPIHRCTYRDIHLRSKQLARALTAPGVKPGDRIGTLAWNGCRHMEIYYGVSGMGAVLHTVNPRLFPEQILDADGFFDTGDVAFMPELPHTATGKPQKMKLRERFRDYRLPDA